MYFFNITKIIRKNFIEIHFKVKIYVSTLCKNIELGNSLFVRNFFARSKYFIFFLSDIRLSRI